MIPSFAFFAYFALSQLSLLGLVLYLVRRSEARGAEEVARLQLFSESAMAHLVAKTLEEKVTADSLKKFQSYQIEKLKDVEALETAHAKEAKKAETEEKLWKTAEGGEISSKEYEIVS